MTVNEVKNHFVTWANLMRQLGYSKHAYQNWQRNDKIPYHIQVVIERITEGRLRACAELKADYERKSKGKREQ